MQVWRTLAEVPGGPGSTDLGSTGLGSTDLGSTVVTIGNFDGMHRGHRHVLAQCRRIADELGVATVVAVTFDPHPMAVLRPEHAPPILTSIEERLPLFDQADADAVMVLPFDLDMAGWSPEEFVDRVLVQLLHARAVVVGGNFRFGRRAAGDVALLHELGPTRGFEVFGVTLDGGPQVWSSTYIRNCLAAGDVEGAAEALGRPFAVRGIVQRGDQRGRELGFPTANLPDRGQAATPADGVYAGWLRVLEATHPDFGAALPAAISVGTNPTFSGERARRVEAFVLDRDDLELYGVEVEVCFVKRLRGMRTFASIEELIAAMRHDVAETRAALL
ncbi:MAG: bifunctional riboflavin kinase/FAD synthetase [Nocardioides sp.]